MASRWGLLALSLVICLTVNSPVNCSNDGDIDDTTRFVSFLINLLNNSPAQSNMLKQGASSTAEEKSSSDYKLAVIEPLCNNPEECYETSLICHGIKCSEDDVTPESAQTFDSESESTKEKEPQPQEVQSDNSPQVFQSHQAEFGAPVINKPKLQNANALDNIPVAETHPTLSSEPTENGPPHIVVNDTVKSPQAHESNIYNKLKDQMKDHQYIIEDSQRVILSNNEHSYDRPETFEIEQTANDQELKSSDEEQDLHSVQLTHEVEPVGKATSGEQFVAVRRVDGGSCSDCASDVDVNATGVDKLVALALQHLDRHDAPHRHELNAVVRVQRQVQIVNGVRYILLLDVNVLNITDKYIINTDIRRCKVSFLEKPWIRLSDGSKFRAVISNNCTEQYLYSDNGEVVSDNLDLPNNEFKKDDFNEHNVNYPDSPPLGDQAQGTGPFDPKAPNYDSIANSGKADDILKMVQNKELYSAQPSDELPISPERLEALVSQIIPTKNTGSVKHFDESSKPYSHSQNAPHATKQEFSVSYDVPKYHEEKEALFKPVEYDNPNDGVTTKLSENKKEAISDFLKLLDGFDNFSSPNSDQDTTLSPEHTKSDIFLNTEIGNERTVKDCYLKTRPVFVPEEPPGLDEIVDFMGDSSSLEDDTVISYIIRKKRSIFDKTSDSEDYILSLANLAIERLDEFDDDNKKRMVLNVLAVETDNKNKGILYKMLLKVGYSNCLENEVISIECSSAPQLYQVNLCKVHVFVGFVGNPKVVDAQCHHDKNAQQRNKRAIVGGHNLVQPDDKQIISLAYETLGRLEASRNLTNRHKILKIESASRQLVSGLNFEIDFQLGYTDCPKSDLSRSLKQCNVVDNSEEQCHANIYYQPWRQSIPKDIKVNCKKMLPTRSKRSLNLKHTDETLWNLLTDALAQVEKKYSNVMKQQVDEILYFGRPYFSDVLHRIEFTVGLTNCSTLSHDDHCSIRTDLTPKTTCTAEFRKHNTLEAQSFVDVNCETNDSYIEDIIKARMHFDNFILKYDKAYINDDTELFNRFQIFHKNLKLIKDLNFHEQGTATYGITQFADLTEEEFRNKYTGLNFNLQNENNIPMPMAEIPEVDDIPDAFDWRSLGAVTEVKNQGQCGSCWAFSVTGNIEGQWKIAKGELLSLSEQELVDCDKLDDGCNGGLPDNAYRAIEQLGGLEVEKDYPYDAADEKCYFNKSLSRVQISGAVNISSVESDMQKWLLKNGPISIGINANAMQFYMGGVSHPWKILCNPKNLDHGVLIVGYGVHDYPLFKKKLPFWTIKNSWGESWGEQGYYRVYRGDGTCGVNQMASSAIVS